MLKLLRMGLLLMVVVSGCDCGPPACFDLVYNAALDTCECPAGTAPNYDLDRCEGPDGQVIDWREIDPSVQPIRPIGMSDGGQDVSIEVGSRDAGPDVPLDARPDVSTAAPPAPTLRHPWNGLTTGSVHVATEELVAHHPLRPRFTWSRVSEADSYQIQMTRACTVEGFRECEFGRTDVDERVMGTTFQPEAELSVATIAPVGSRYYWRVRACAGESCSDWSEIRYLDVGREGHDLNGDGYADLVVGAIALGETGVAYVFFGSSTGPSAEPDVAIPDPADSMANFGTVNYVGDTNADGYFDIVVGGKNTERTGLAYLFLGGPVGPSAIPNITYSLPDTAINDGLFGESIAGADFDGDGFSDVVVGAAGEGMGESGEGVIHLFPGSATPSDLPAMSVDHPNSIADGGFGVLATGGDLNGDGLADLAVGAPGTSGQEGAAFVFFGAQSGFLDAVDVEISNPESQGGEFGGQLAIGDLDGDDLADLVIAARLQSLPETNEGAVYLFHGSDSGPTGGSFVVVENPLNISNGWFGQAAMVADFNGDGFAELSVGAPRQTVLDLPDDESGAVYVFVGRMSGTMVESPNSLTNPVAETFLTGGFGLALGGGDFNGDGFADIAVGAPQQADNANNEGLVHLFFGGPAGVQTTAAATIDNPTDEFFGFFGNSIAR